MIDCENINKSTLELDQIKADWFPCGNDQQVVTLFGHMIVETGDGLEK